MHRVGSLLGGRRWTHLAAHEARSRSRPARARRARARLLLRVSACPARRPVAHPHSSHPRPRHRTLVGRAHPCHGKNGTKNELAGAVSAGHARDHQPRLKFGLSRRCSIDAALLRTQARRHEACASARLRPSRISPLRESLHEVIKKPSAMFRPSTPARELLGAAPVGLCVRRNEPPCPPWRRLRGHHASQRCHRVIRRPPAVTARHRAP